MENKKTYEVPTVLVFAVDDFLSTADGSTEIGGGYPDIWDQEVAKMKLRINKVKLIIASCLALVAVAFGALSFTVNNKTVKAAGTKLTSTEYLTDGSSMRIFRSVEDSEAAKDTGLRFHVEMGNGYVYNGTPVVNTSEKNASNGSFKLNEGFKTYTLIIPTRLLNGDLTITTDKVLKLETSNFWYFDTDGNLESRAYVYNVPSHRYTDTFSFRGVICDANDNVLSQTPIAERCLVEIAKKSYVATVNGTEDWGDDTRKGVALQVLESYIPTYDVVYKDAEGNTLNTETVMWGNVPQSAPTGNSLTSVVTPIFSAVCRCNVRFFSNLYKTSFSNRCL